jgi:uncharacterized membrane protein (DUF485 family)
VSEALWLLLWLRFRGFLRRLGRGLRTVKGALLAVVFGLIFLGYVVGMIAGMFALRELKERPNTRFMTSNYVDGRLQQVPLPVDPGPGLPEPDQVRRYGTLGLAAYCLAVVLMSTGGSGLVFTPAEINFLFPGPFTRRRLLAYKLVQPALVVLPIALMVSPGVMVFAGSFLGAFLAILFAFLFIQLFAVAVGLLAAAAGALAYSRARKLLLGAAFAVLAVGLVVTRQAGPAGEPPLETLRRLEQSAFVKTVLAPLGWFFDLFTAEQFWPDLARAAALTVGVLVALLALLFGLDASFLEASAAASERTYARLQRMRSGSVAAGLSATAGRPRFSLPMPPTWGGVGPVLWRQVLTAVRSLKGITLLFLLVGLMACWPIILSTRGVANEVTGGSLLGILVMLSILLTNVTAFDFRGDLDRMDLLKALPIAPWRVVLGQLAAPVILASLVQAALLVLLYLFIGGLGEAPLVMALFTPPFNVITYGLDNLLFLVYPTRLVAAPGDLRTALRQMILMFGKMLLLGIGAGVAAGLSALVFWLTDSWPIALVVAWFTLAALAVPLIPLMALAFRHFDVSSDVP